MKKIFLFLLIVMTAGCAYEGKPLRSYLNDPGSIINDPHYTRYQQERDELEKSYLNKEITYGEYVQAKGKLDEQYNKEVKEREAVILHE